MKNVRIWFKKDNECRYISHLDLNKCVLRALHKSRLPVWHTEGFNPHPFVTFPLPLSLGFRGTKECMDVKMLEDISSNDIISKLNACLPSGVEVYSVTEPVMKPGKIAYAVFDIELFSDDVTNAQLYDMLIKLFNMNTIIINKKSKSGIKEIDLKPNLSNYTVEKGHECINIHIVLPAGSTSNINPSLIVNALEKYFNITVYSLITRLDVLNEEGASFE